jgi:hypothetical protein
VIGRVVQTILMFLALTPAPAPVPAAAPSASADDGRLSARLETGDFSEFDQAEALHGELLNTADRAYDGRRSMLAAYCAGGRNGYARGDFSVTLNQGNDVWYGAALYLPAGFRKAMQGEVDLLRWDNFGLYGKGADYGGLVVWSSDGRARLVRGHYGGGQNVLADPMPLPLGRWFWVEVHQHLSNRGSQALNEVWIDGRRVRRSNNANSYGRRIDRIRFGLVAIEQGRQRRPLELWADRATVSPTMVGPRAGAGASGPTQSRGPHTPRRVGGRCM